MAVLITGGSGYIGSHTCAELLEAGREIIVVDRPEHAPVLDRVQAAVGKDFRSIRSDPIERRGLQRMFEENEIEAVIHFAGLQPAAMPQKDAICRLRERSSCATSCSSSACGGSFSVRRPRSTASRSRRRLRKVPARRGQPVRADDADDRGDFARSVRSGPEMEHRRCCAISIRRGASERVDRRRGAGDGLNDRAAVSRKPPAEARGSREAEGAGGVHGASGRPTARIRAGGPAPNRPGRRSIDAPADAGGRRSAGQDARLRRRLSDPRRHMRPGLCPCDGPGEGPSEGARQSDGGVRLRRLQPGHGRRSQRAGGDRGIRKASGVNDPLPDRRTAAGRRAGHLRRSVESPAGAGLAGRNGPRANMRGRLAVAAPPQGRPPGGSPPGCSGAEGAAG